MLENIKQMILEKKEYLEASQLIFEGTVESDLDDLIVLNEDSNYNEGVIDKIKDFFSSKPDPEVVAKFYKDGNVNYSTKLTREDCKKLHIRGEAKDLVNSIFDYMDDLTLDQLLKLIAVGMQEDGKYDGRIIGNQTNSSNHLGIACKKIGGNFILFDYPSNDKKYSTGCIYINIESKKVYEFSEGDAECKRSNISSLSLPTDKKYEIASSLEKFLNNGFGDEHDSSDKNWQRKLITMFVNPSKEDGLKDTRLESTENHNESVAIGIGAATIALGYGIYRFWQWRKDKAQIRQIFSEIVGHPINDVGVYRKAAQRELSAYFSQHISDITEHAYGWSKPINRSLDIEFTTSTPTQRNIITWDNPDPMDYDDVHSGNLTFVDFHGLSEVMIIEKSELPYFTKLNSSNIFKLSLWEYNNLAPTEGNITVWSILKQLGLVTVTPDDLTYDTTVQYQYNGQNHVPIINQQGARGNDALMKQMMEELAEVKKNYIICCPMPMVLVKDFMQQYGNSIVTEGFDVSIFDSDDSFFEADDESETSNTEDVTESDSSAEEGNVTDSEGSEDILDTEIPSGEEEPDEAEGETDADGGLLDTPVDDGSMDSIADYGAGDSSFDNEPTELSDDDILSVTIDLKSNTMTDVLPIPPDNAGEAVNDDILSTRVDSGFDETNIQSEPPAVQTESSNSFLEGITLGGDGDSSDEDNEPAPDEEPADENADENEVTSAVKDKVAEAESEEEPLVDDGEDLGSGDSSAKEALMKKLSSITKSLEDAKNAVLKSL